MLIDNDFSDRKETKNNLKKVIYKLLNKKLHKDLPWGTLTGIRPVKIPEMLIGNGVGRDEIEKIMKSDYLIGDEKMNLAIDIAYRQKELLDKINYKDGYSLYVGIPFCPTTCLYCSFTSYPISRYRNLSYEYVKALKKELSFIARKMKNRELNTIYIGGGTPTTLEPEQLDDLIKHIKSEFDTKNISEFTVEAGRPDSITKEKLEVLKVNDVDRISINPQTMNQKTLDLIGRKHSVEDVYKSFEIARNVGFDNINMDIILGLWEEDKAMVKHTLSEIKKLSPENLTVHSLAIKRAARVSMQGKKYDDLVSVNNDDLMELARKSAKEMGMDPYYLYRQKNMSGNQENIGYSKPGLEGLYNILMMGDFQDVIAAGAGAVSKIISKDRLKGDRIENLKSVDEYVKRIDEMIDRKSKI